MPTRSTLDPAFPHRTPPAADGPPRRGPVRRAPRSGHRALWISDVHLGTPQAQAERLVAFLETQRCERLYVVGDLIDGLELARRPYWHASHTRVLRALLAMARAGTRVVYLPGNHDALLRGLAPFELSGIEVRRSLVHETADGRRLLVLHGDAFDEVADGHRLLARLGDRAYRLAADLEDACARLLGHRDPSRRSLARRLKERFKDAVAYVERFEGAAVRAARAQGADGVVCGHVHRAGLRTVDALVYANDGDWVESCTALAERHDGALTLLHDGARADAPEREHAPLAAEAA